MPAMMSSFSVVPRRRRMRPGGRVRRAALALLALAAALPAAAQPVLGRGGVGAWGGGLEGLTRRIEAPLSRDLHDEVSETAAGASTLTQQRHAALDALLQREPQRLERTPDGQVVVRGELLLQAPSPALLAAAQAAGFRLEREDALDGLGLSLAVLQAPPGLDSSTALARLRTLGGEAGAADLDPLYLPAGAAVGAASGTASSATPAPAAADGAGAARIATPRVGLVDGGVDVQQPSLRDAAIEQRATAAGCAGVTPPDRHGTAVASLLVGRDGRFRGAVPDARLYAADIYCGDAANGSAEAVVRALAWLAAERVPVINLSIVGPPNRLLERAVAALVQRGHLLVAAVGNDGPAAPPLYPAAYPGVVGVTGVSPQGRVLPEALQGPQVAFAAPGSALAAADDGGYRAQRGTSFAAPFVAGLLAQRLDAPDPVRAAQARASLARAAIDLGAPGRDPVYGEGWVGRELRVDPAALAAAR